MSNSELETPILSIENVSKRFVKSLDLAGKIAQKLGARVREEIVHAVDGVSIEIKDGEVVGLVGESGCGKSTLGRVVAGVHGASDGRVLFRGQDVANLEGIEAREAALKIQMIFQDPYESLNPRWNIKDIILEPLNIHNIGSLSEREDAVVEILKTVGLTPPENYLPRYPHELSGGQRQRVSIARTLIMKPKFVVCDEPTSMLDVSIRISIMDLMLNLAKDLEVSYLYITHDLAVARYMCNRIAVMFNGKIVEIAETEELLKNPIHPYTKRLISSIPVPDPTYERVVYDIDYTELDNIISTDTENIGMVDIGNEHFVATHDVKGIL